MTARVTAAAEPALRALAPAPASHLAGVFERAVAVAASGWIVHVSTDPVELVCSVQVSDADLARLRRLPVGVRVRLDADGAPQVPMRLEPGEAPLHRFAAPTGWFGSPDGRAGLPRLRTAASALLTDSENTGSENTHDDLAAVLGLGPGLTPSGDDALVGVLAVAWASTGRPPGADSLLGLLASAPAPTTPTSLTYLRLAAGGEFSGPVRGLVGALRSGRGVDGAVRRVAALGHSSGADLLTGMDVALGLLAGHQNGTRPG